MDSTSIKLEPGTSAEESACEIFTETDMYYPFIKNECLESIFENNSGETSPTEHSNLEDVTIKAEPGREEIEISYSGADIELPDIKKECLEQSERIHQMKDEISAMEYSHQEGVTIKAEPRIKEEAESGLLCSEIDIELPDIKKECLEHSERTPQPAGSAFMVTNISFFQQKRDRKLSNYSKSFPSSKSDIKPTSMPGLITYLRTHTKEKPFLCSFCNYSCSYKSQLIGHIRTHTKEKPFPCSYCNSAFARKGQLGVHYLTHTKENPFSCSYSFCNYSCKTKSSLSAHERTHTEEKPFSCSYCNYSCFQKSRLIVHIRTHTKEKPFSCSYCNFSCSQKANLIFHERTHTRDKSFSCPYCNYSCSRKSSLIIHNFSHTE